MCGVLISLFYSVMKIARFAARKWCDLDGKISVINHREVKAIDRQTDVIYVLGKPYAD